MKALTMKNYKSVLTSVIAKDSVQAETIQEVLMFGFEQVTMLNSEGLQNNNLGVLSDIINASGTMRNKLTKVLTAYIQYHIKHIVWDKEGKRYKKVVDKKLSIEVEVPMMPYYEHESMKSQGHVTPTYDENKRFDSFMTQRDKAIQSGNLKGDDVKLIAQLKMALLTLEAAIKPLELEAVA